MSDPGTLVFVGRREELATLTLATKEAAAGHPAIVAVFGPEGIGKSRLIDELRASAPCPVRTVRCGATSRARRWLRDVDRTKPVVLLVEDLQRASPDDCAALDDVFDAAARGAAPKLAAFCVFRDDARLALHQAEIIGRLLRQCSRSVEVGPLTAEEIEASLVPHALDQSRVEDLVRLSGGNPLLLEQLIESTGEGAALRIPRGIEIALDVALNSIGSAGRDVAYAAAILGSPFSTTSLSGLVPMAPSALALELQRLADARLIEAAGNDRYRFRIELTREAVERRIVPENARRLHAAAARTIATSRARKESVDALARHCERAGWRQRACTLYQIVARRAEEARDFQTAASALAKARAAAPKDARLCAALADAHARLLGFAGRLDEAVVATRELIGYLRAADDLEQLTLKIRERAVLQTRSGRRRAALRDLESDLRALAARDSSVTAPLVRVGNVIATLGGLPFRREQELWQRRVRTRKAHVPPDERADDPMLGGVRALFDQDWPRALRNFSAALASARHPYDAETDFHVTMSVGHYQRFGGLVTEALASYRHAYAVAERERSRWMVHYAGSHLARLLILTGALPEARTVLDRSLGLSPHSMLTRVATAGNAVLLGVLQRDQGLVSRFLDARYFEMAIESETSGTLGDLALAFAIAHRSRNQTERARELVARALERLEQPWEARPFLALAPLLGGPAAAPRSRELLSARTLPNVPGAAPFRDLGAAYAALPERSDAVRQHAQRAARGFRRTGLMLLAAAAEEAAGRRGEALRIFRDCGDAYDAARLAGNRAEREDLTIRQRQIAMLVGSGYSNRDIAERLGISVGTVGVHLHAVYRRLGVGSRAQAAVVLTAGTD